MIPHGTPSGYKYHGCRCDICVTNKKQRDREYYLANQEAKKVKAKEYYAANKDKVAEANRKYREENADKIKAKKAEYAKANSAKLSARAVQWAKENPERHLMNKARYRESHRDDLNQKSLDRYYAIMATDPDHIRKLRRDYAKTPYGRALYQSAQHKRRRQTPYTQEAIDWIASIDWSTEVCTYCQAPAEEIDHILPISKGGTGERDNLTPCCRSCNSRKGNRYLADFLGFVEPERTPRYV